MDKNIQLYKDEIKSKIYTIRGLQVMLDRDLAELYEISTKVLNQAVKRNIERFPKDFVFKLNEKEKEELVTNCDHLQNLKYSYQLPYTFTEQGVAALSGVLKSKKAIEINIQIMRAFISMRKFILKNGEVFIRLDNVERKQIEYQINTDNKFDKVFNAIESKQITPKQGIFFEGQIFDAHKFVSDLIRSANKSIILIDNYIDDSVLTLFSERINNVNVIIYTNRITEKLKLDLKKYNSQYPKIKIKEFKHSHDRFLIIDNKEVYHIGASLKDLGKKWFAFSRLEMRTLELLEKLKIKGESYGNNNK